MSSTSVNQIILTTIIGGFVFVMGLSVNNLIQAIVNKNIKEKGESIEQQFKYTLLVMLFGIISIYVISKIYTYLTQASKDVWDVGMKYWKREE
jgi:Na+-driven multidrug efflux pump